MLILKSRSRKYCDVLYTNNLVIGRQGPEDGPEPPKRRVNSGVSSEVPASEAARAGLRVLDRCSSAQHQVQQRCHRPEMVFAQRFTACHMGFRALEAVGERMLMEFQAEVNDERLIYRPGGPFRVVLGLFLALSRSRELATREGVEGR